MDFLHFLATVPLLLFVIIGGILMKIGGIWLNSDFPETGWSTIFIGIFIFVLGMAPRAYFRDKFPFKAGYEYYFSENWDDPHVNSKIIKIISFKDGYVQYTDGEITRSNTKTWMWKHLRTIEHNQ